MRCVICAVAAASLLIGCKKESAPVDAPAAAEAPKAAEKVAEEAAAPAAENPVSTNGLSEAQFKALHQLKGEAAPAPKGEMIALGGGQHYLSLPEGAEAPMSAVVVIHEWWGLNDHIKHYADRLAAEGYAALAVDLYGGKSATTPDEAMAMMQKVDAAAAEKTLAAAAQFLADDARIKADKRGVIGWCFGGAWSLQAGLKIEGLDAVVMYYGRVVTDPEKLTGLDAPLLGIFANQDDHIPPAQVKQFEEALAAAGKPAQIERYDAHHAFANPSSDRYDAEAAADAWQKARGFLARHLTSE